jgi:hypothetical protein
MKTNFTLWAFLGISLITISPKVIAQTNTFPSTGAAGIGTLTPNASALLEINSTSKGLLISRMTKAQRDAIAAPTVGLLIYQTNNTPGFYYYSGSAWMAVSAKGVNKSLSNLSAPTAVNADLLPGTDNTINLGSTSFRWKSFHASDDALINGLTIGRGSGSIEHNTAIGVLALFSNTIGIYNTAIGYRALYSDTSGSYNSAYGYQALLSNTSGLANTAIGFNTLYSNTGNYNTATGYSALAGNASGTYNSAYGYGADGSSNNFTNATALGYGAIVNASNKVRIGNGNVTVVESAVGSWTTSDGRFKTNVREQVKGLAFIKLLRPVIYNFDVERFEEFLMQNYPDSIRLIRMAEMRKGGAPQISLIRQSGFIAQEVAEAAKKAGYDFNGVHAPENPTDNWSLSYEKLVVPLVKAVQELSAKNDAKDAEINDLKTRLAKLEAIMNLQQSAVSKN